MNTSLQIAQNINTRSIRELEILSANMQSMVKSCDDRMRELEEEHEMKKLNIKEQQDKI